MGEERDAWDVLDLFENCSDISGSLHASKRGNNAGAGSSAPFLPLPHDMCPCSARAVSYTHLRAHETEADL
eukprot:3357802-Rhodomonas_salina.4